VGTVLSAGLEPSILQLGLVMEELCQRPGTWRELSRDVSRVPPVLEELLRYRSTNPGVVRAFEEDVEQRGRMFKSGSRVHISIANANHDPRRFARPDEFDVEANNATHMAFGFGPHHCLGAPLVRAQLQEALSVLVQRLECPEMLEVERKHDHGPAGPLKLALRVSKRPGG
jgi:cytochrome P450